MATVKRERTTLSLSKVANAGMEAPPAITSKVIKPVSMIPMIVFNHFVFFASRLRASISSSKNAPISVNFSNRYVCGSRGAEGFKSG